MKSKNKKYTIEDYYKMEYKIVTNHGADYDEQLKRKMKQMIPVVNMPDESGITGLRMKSRNLKTSSLRKSPKMLVDPSNYQIPQGPCCKA